MLFVEGMRVFGENCLSSAHIFTLRLIQETSIFDFIDVWPRPPIRLMAESGTGIGAWRVSDICLHFCDGTDFRRWMLPR